MTQTWKDWAPCAVDQPVTVVAASESAWEGTGFAGVEVRRLFLDAAHDRATMLMRMAPGATYPAHRHGGVEECYVLDGDLRRGDVVLRAGDYQRAAPDSVHAPQASTAGCLLFVVSSLRDEILERHA